MATVKLNPIIEQIRGQVGDLVFKRYEDRVILSRKPDLSGKEPTPAQQEVRDRFRQAAIYGKVILADPDVRERYEDEARRQRKPVFSLTIADFFHAPSIDEIDLSDYHGAKQDPIRITATDDFEVARVEVTMTGKDGNVIETGEAEMEKGRWVYLAQTAVRVGTEVRIEVRATDHPGGVGTQTAEATT